MSNPELLDSHALGAVFDDEKAHYILVDRSNRNIPIHYSKSDF